MFSSIGIDEQIQLKNLDLRVTFEWRSRNRPQTRTVVTSN